MQNKRNNSTRATIAMHLPEVQGGYLRSNPLFMVVDIILIYLVAVHFSP